MLDEVAGVGPQFPPIVPAQGSPLGGDTVTIRAAGLTAATTVTFGGVPATKISFLDDSELAAVTPPGTGTVEVAVTTPGAGAPTVTNLAFEYAELSLSILRADDLLSLTVEFVNLDLVGATLTRRDRSQPAVVVITLPPQHIKETEFPVLSGPPGDPPVTGVVAGPSRLAFTVPDSITSLPLDLPTVLGWDGWEVVPPAVAPGYPPPAPGPQTTALELPYRLFLTPGGAPTWTHRTASGLDPVTGQAEVWRTTAAAPALRVTWSPDVISDALPAPALVGPLQPSDRAQLAQPPQELDSGDLVLSMLGASVDMGVSLSGSGSLADWRQVVADGRDSYVRVVDRGYLLPFGHAAAVTTVSQRGPAPSVGGIPLEAMESISILTVTQPLVDFDGRFPADRPPLPFRSVRILTLTTPPVTVPDPGPSRVLDASGAAFGFHLLAEDLSGAAVHLTMPLVYVPDGAVVQPSTWQSLGDAADLSGRQVAFVPPAAATAAAVADLTAAADASLLPVSGMSFKLVAAASGGSGPLSMLPQMDQALVSLPAVDAVAGPSGLWSMTYHSAYLTNGLGQAANAGQVFASVAAAAGVTPPLTLPADQAGGLASPVMAIDGLSRTLGPVPRSADLANGLFQPQQALAAGAHLLGGLKLSDLLQELGSVGGDTFDQAKLPALTRLPTPTAGVQTSFTWSPALKPGKVELGFLEIDLTGTTLSLVGQSTANLTGPPTAVVDGLLKNVTLVFLDAVELVIDHLNFHAEHGSKTKLTTGKKLAISFIGDLQFLTSLASALPSDGFADLPSFDVTSAGVTAGFSVGLPAIGVGIISIENVSFTAKLSLPFTAPLGLSLAFSDRDHPFLVTVSLISGGGFFAIDVGTDGVRRIEGSLELGANLSVDLLIVTANVHVLAGFYFGMTSATPTAPATTSFSAFLRIGGSVDLLGIISVSIELYLALSYNDDHDAITGTASLTLSVHVLFVTKSLTLSVHKSFAVPGASGSHALASRAGVASADDPPPPTFEDQLTIDDWRAYCQAFA